MQMHQCAKLKNYYFPGLFLAKLQRHNESANKTINNQHTTLNIQV
jgi:hypothetical protein